MVKAPHLRFALAASVGAMLSFVASEQACAATPAIAVYVSTPSGAKDCASKIFPSTLPTALVSTRVQKATAILGGSPSALEQIRMSQSAGYRDRSPVDNAAQDPSLAFGLPATCKATGMRPNATAAATPAYASILVAPQLELEGAVDIPQPSYTSMLHAPPLTLDTDSHGLGAPLRSSIVPPSALGAENEVFLGSPRISIGKTEFDSRWDRVSRKHLTKEQVTRSMGRPAAGSLALVGQVNTWANRITDQSDMKTWGQRDYWADAVQTLRLGSGDCEDIAILKYQALLALGYNPADLFLTLTYDLVRRSDHMVLIVRHAGLFYLLDDSTDSLLDASTANEYRPVLSFGSGGKWLHGVSAVPARPIYLSLNAVSNALSIGMSR
jgi:predicted transglutaminase-like cysteine proteinase